MEKKYVFSSLSPRMNCLLLLLLFTSFWWSCWHIINAMHMEKPVNAFRFLKMYLFLCSKKKKLFYSWQYSENYAHMFCTSLEFNVFMYTPLYIDLVYLWNGLRNNSHKSHICLKLLNNYLLYFTECPFDKIQSQDIFLIITITIIIIIICPYLSHGTENII